jgi:uncharacterized protein YdhG (YjbR/CyaY superfamily)
VIAPDERVTAYIAAAPPDRHEALTALRRICRERLQGFAEELRYGLPCYVRDGEAEIGFANQRRYVSLYVVRTDVMQAYRAALLGLSLGKGCVRYRRADQIDLEVVGAMLDMTAASRGPVC